MADPQIKIVLAVKDETSGKLKEIEGKFVQSMGAMGAAGKGLDTAFSGIKGTLAGLGVVLSVGGLASFSKSVLDAGIEAEKLDRAFKAIAGSAEGAKSELTFLKTESDRLGQNFYKVAQGYKGIFAGAKEAGVATSDLHATFTGVTEALTVMGASSEDAERAFRAIGQSFGKGKVMAEEVRQQFGEVIPTAFAMMAKGMGVSTAQLDKMLQSGNVGLDAWTKMARVMHETYGPSVADAAKTAAAAVNKLDEAWTNFKMSLARFGGESAAKGIQSVSDGLNSVSSDIEKIEKASKNTDSWRRFKDGFFNAEGMSAKPFAFWTAISQAIREVHYELGKTSSGDFMSVESQAVASNTKNLGDLVKNLTKEYQKLAQARSDVLGRGIEGKLADQEKALNTELQKGVQLREVIKGLDDERANLIQGFDRSAQNLDELQAQVDDINAAIAERRAGPSVGMFGDIIQLTRQRDIVMGLIADEQEQAKAIEQQVALNDRLYEIKAEMLRVSEQQAQIRQGEEIQGMISALQQRMETGSIGDAETQRLITSILEKRTKLETDLNAKLTERDDRMVRMTALSGMAGYDATADRERVNLLDQSIAKTKEWIEGAKTSTQGVTERIFGLTDALKQAADANTAVIDKQIQDANARYASVLDFIQSNPIVIDANIDPLRDKLQTVLSEIDRVQRQAQQAFQGIAHLNEGPLSGFSLGPQEIVFSPMWSESPAVPFQQGYESLLSRLDAIPKEHTYTMSWDGMSRQMDMRDYNYVSMTDFSGADPKIMKQLSEAINNMTAYAHQGAGFGNFNSMAAYYHDLIPQLQQAALASIGNWNVSASGGSSVPVSSGGGGTTFNIGPINISLQGSGNSRDDVITMADRLDEELAVRWKSNRSKLRVAAGV